MYATTPLRAEPKLIFGSWVGSLPTLHEISVGGHSCQDRPPDGSSKSGSPDVAGRVAIESSELVSHSAHPLQARAEPRASFGS